MSYVIGANCIDVLDRECIQVCPVDCIYVGNRKSYINADECIDCGACEEACPVNSITSDRVAKKDEAMSTHLVDQRDFFEMALPGRDEPLGNPGGAAALGDIRVDTPLVAAHETP